jgi:predicted nucleic acid-binding protein
MRIVVDTNVIVSALVFGGVPLQIMDLVLTGACSFHFSPPLRAEVERILEEKFGWGLPEISVRSRASQWARSVFVSAFARFLGARPS